MKLFLILILPFAVLYLGTSFVHFTLDASQWTENTRFLTVYIGVCLCVGIYFFNKTELK